MRYLALLILSATLASAYVMPPDKVIIDGRLTLTNTRPLSTFPWRGDHPQLSEHPYQGASDSRELEALWEIKDAHLYLVAVSAYRFDEFAPYRSVGLRELMPDRIHDGRVLADWFTGDFDVIEIERVEPGLALLSKNAPPMHVVRRIFHVDKGHIEEVTNKVADRTEPRVTPPASASEERRRDKAPAPRR